MGRATNCRCWRVIENSKEVMLEVMSKVLMKPVISTGMKRKMRICEKFEKPHSRRNEFYTDGGPHNAKNVENRTTFPKSVKNAKVC